MRKKTVLALLILAILGFSFPGCRKAGENVESALSSMSEEELSQNTRWLASDELEGRFPASKGEEKTITFLEGEFKKLGLQPGNGGSFFQEVPMVEINADQNTKLAVTKGKESISFEFGREFVAVTLRVVPEVALSNTEMVFAGYGIVAPEYNWNDYEGLDARGKTGKDKHFFFWCAGRMSVHMPLLPQPVVVDDKT